VYDLQRILDEIVYMNVEQDYLYEILVRIMKNSWISSKCMA